MRDGYDALIRLGGASPGDKTMLDSLLPFVEELERRVGDGEQWQDAWRAAADVATEAAKRDRRPAAEGGSGPPARRTQRRHTRRGRHLAGDVRHDRRGLLRR